MVDPTILRELLAQAQTQGGGFTEALVVTGHVSDWDLSRIVCEIFQLPFLPVSAIEPDPGASDGLDKDFLRQHALVPMGRYGQVLTISMPALVPADVLGMLAAESDLVVLPVVGSVQTNRAWVEERLAPKPVKGAKGKANWDEIFDDADAAVLLDLQKLQEKDPDGGGLEFSIDANLGDAPAETDLAGLEYAAETSEASAPSTDDLDIDAPGMGPSGTAALPPMPRFSA